MVIDALFGLILSAFLGFIYTEIRDIRAKVDSLESKILVISLHIRKRKDDTS